MSKRTRSLLQEINDLAPKKDKVNILESRGNNALSAIINVLDMIDESYDATTAQDLQKRIMLCIKNRDTERFSRGIKQLRKSS